VENCIQDCKSTTKFRCSADPEVLLVNRVMTQQALAVVKRDHGYRDGQRYVQMLDERISKMRAGDSVLHIIDHGDATTGSQLLGLGSVVAVQAQQEQMISSIQQFVSESPDVWRQNFPNHDVEDCTLTTFSRAHLRGVETILSEAYAAVRSQFSHFGLAEWEGQGRYVVKIKQYVKVEAPDNLSPHSTTHAGPMRFAICNLYQQTLVDNALGECHIVTLQEQTHQHTHHMQ